MNLLKCNNGHYYDGDKFDICPHCSGMAGSVDQAKDVTVPGSVAVDDGPVLYQEPPTAPPTAPPTWGKTEPKDDDKTQGWWNLNTITDVTGGKMMEPVVGWLVCIDGSEIGRSFNLKAGKNFIGRMETVNDVVLSDNSVSREKHAIVIFDPKSRTFLAQPGMSSELFYLNDTVVLQAVEIKHRDLIQIGNTKLMFVPFCDADFIWDDCKKGE